MVKKKYTPQQKTYFEKLKDPRWQKKRLEIFNRDEFRCITCGDKESTLNVHHLKYEKGFEPWDYDNKCLITLCESCHAYETLNLKDAYYELSLTIKDKMPLSGDIYRLSGFLDFLDIKDDKLIDALEWAICNKEHLFKLIESHERKNNEDSLQE